MVKSFSNSNSMRAASSCFLPHNRGEQVFHQVLRRCRPQRSNPSCMIRPCLKAIQPLYRPWYAVRSGCRRRVKLLCRPACTSSIHRFPAILPKHQTQAEQKQDRYAAFAASLAASFRSRLEISLSASELVKSAWLSTWRPVIDRQAFFRLSKVEPTEIRIELIRSDCSG